MINHERLGKQKKELEITREWVRRGKSEKARESE